MFTPGFTLRCKNKGGTRNVLFLSLLRSFAGGNSKETIRHFMPHLQSVMHVLCVAHVQSAGAKRGARVERANVFAH